MAGRAPMEEWRFLFAVGAFVPLIIG
ncbi:uncharacterized protein METZ01_LOCUS206668 [marine metagenome]|uniref:Uncharacterized protein n=1 Tax=marine metagenome TaxID=408172 RepID=A0A382EUG5_9ZZZZ